MLQKTGGLFSRTGAFFRKAALKVYSPPVSLCEQNKKIWYSVNGDKTLRVEYDLSPGSVVFDVGGYEGDWAAEMAARYGPRIFVFEPVTDFYEKLKKRFLGNKNISVYNYGLSNKDEEIEFNVMDESSTVFGKKKPQHVSAVKRERCMLKAFDGTAHALPVNKIDLMKVNIEGGEYALLEHIIDTGWVKNIDNIQVQFHDFVPDAQQRMDRIKQKLSATHRLTYEYIFVWENWRKK